MIPYRESSITEEQLKHLAFLKDAFTSISRTYPGESVGSMLGWSVTLSLCRRLWTVTERPKRLVTLLTFDQSDEAR